MKRLLIILFSVMVAVGVSSVRGADTVTEQEVITPAMRERAITVLRETMDRETRWIKVHAAEYLLELSYPLGVKTAFEAELAAYENQPQYRIGIWRVLARSATTAEERQMWVDRIRAVVTDKASKDRVHALE
ncbi:MAG: Na+/solute symporter, partial [Planctomycetaceae bacterium]|nr:Na+/solute symporter [Planctomycetaceae bacterium]